LVKKLSCYTLIVKLDFEQHQFKERKLAQCINHLVKQQPSTTSNIPTASDSVPEEYAIDQSDAKSYHVTQHPQKTPVMSPTTSDSKPKCDSKIKLIAAKFYYVNDGKKGSASMVPSVKLNKNKNINYVFQMGTIFLHY